MLTIIFHTVFLPRPLYSFSTSYITFYIDNLFSAILFIHHAPYIQNALVGDLAVFTKIIRLSKTAPRIHIFPFQVALFAARNSFSLLTFLLALQLEHRLFPGLGFNRADC